MSALRIRLSSGSILVLLLGLFCLVFMGACGDDDDTVEPPGQGAPVIYTGEVNGSDFFVAIARNQEGDVIAYACDGEQVGEWFKGTVADGGVSLTSKAGASLKAQLDEDAAAGTLTIAGESYAFTAGHTQGVGFFRVDGHKDETRFVAGWIVLPGGRQKGLLSVATSTGTKVMRAPELSHQAISDECTFGVCATPTPDNTTSDNPLSEAQQAFPRGFTRDPSFGLINPFPNACQAIGVCDPPDWWIQVVQMCSVDDPPEFCAEFGDWF